MRRFSLIPILSLAVALRFASAQTGSSVVEEMNSARQNPARYAEVLAGIRARCSGGAIALPGGTRIHLHEGTRSLDEAIQFLRSTAALPALTTSAGLNHAAHDHCSDQAAGGFGHAGTDGSHGGDRMSRYGALRGGWAENVAYGKSSARDVVLALIIDDGQPARKHRRNIFNPAYNAAGAAFGTHARFGSICTIDFAGGYDTGGEPAAEPLIARNF